ncbi:hypothetical protein [Arenicella xantha]|uniref:Uncharacterized protein n=1 Tax=Arenicella xantha TaxID=644221 RepID=A0A395JPI9_9GAMM|nr:hypothetical protein [Arenicella xantha]RBP53519.1 hypothetical protein DFR28_101906 [Arenicella xantha]
MRNDQTVKKDDETNEKLATMMDDIVERIEAGEVTKAATVDAEAARAAGVISWGSENGVVVGHLPDGTKADPKDHGLEND